LRSDGEVELSSYLLSPRKDMSGNRIVLARYVTSEVAQISSLI
jgi:hypothetical protein